MKKYLLCILIIGTLKVHAINQIKNESCKITYQENDKSFLLQCGWNLDRFEFDGDKSPLLVFQSILKKFLERSNNKVDDEKALKSFILGKIEGSYEYVYPGDESLILDLVSQLESINSGHNIIIECEEDKVKSEEIVPFVDVYIEDISEKRIVRELSDEKMKEEGFLNLGKLEQMSINLSTDNDNFLHGAGRILTGSDEKPNAWWEGDDRGYTFGESLELKFDFEEGSLRGKQYTQGYGSLASVIRNVESCSNGHCRTIPVEVRRDENNRRYQTFMTIDGLELELRRNNINGDLYVKLGGSVERLTDGNKGLAQIIQTAWHSLDPENTVQYHNLKHMDDHYRVQVNTGVGIDKKYNVNNWLSLRGAIEGNVQLSTDGLSNSYVGIRTELSIDSGSFLRPHPKQVPVMEAKLYADIKKYGDNDKAYVNAGVMLFGNVYSDKNGNIVSLYAGAEHFENPSSRKFGHAEIHKRQRVDINHVVGIRYNRKF